MQECDQSSSSLRILVKLSSPHPHRKQKELLLPVWVEPLLPVWVELLLPVWSRRDYRWDAIVQVHVRRYGLWCKMWGE